MDHGYNRAMRWLAALVAFGGCNQAFGLDDTTLMPGLDGGPTSCPAGGPTTFTGAPSVVHAGSCDSFMIDEAGTLATARCGTSIVEGAPDGTWTPTSLDRATYDMPRLA